ncbi:hypothetical protein JCM8547_008861 [Rhodosporidiobolus lusitaniae]
MPLRRLAPALLPRSPHCPFSSFASSSRTTLDSPLLSHVQPEQAEWQHLVHPPLRLPPPPQEPQKGNYSSRLRRRRASSPLPSSSQQQNERAHQERRASDDPTPSRPLHDPTQISPSLPLFTRERSFLLSSLRSALYSRSSPPSSSSKHGGRRVVRHKRQSWDPDEVWVALARCLRYPEEVPEMGRSWFASSTRAVQGEGKEGEGEQGEWRDALGQLYGDSPSPSSSSARGDEGFFTSSRSAPSSSPCSSSLPSSPLPRPSPGTSGRTPLTLSHPELLRAFTILSTSRPRTRTGLDRLLVVAELLAQSKGAVLPSPSPSEGDHGEGGGKTVRLQGGGVGLPEKGWTQLLLFAGASLRTTRPEPDMKSVLRLFGQYLAASSSSSSAPAGGRKREGRRIASKKKKQEHLVLYTSLLHLATRARMFELFEQVRGRMRAVLGVEVGGVELAAEEFKLADARGAGVERLWAVFEGWVRAAAREKRGEQEGEGEGEERKDKVLWELMLWALAKRGELEDAMRLYTARRTGEAVDLSSLRPSSLSSSSSVTNPLLLPLTVSLPSHPFLVLPPPLTDASYTALLQSFSYRGDLHGALRILRDLLSQSQSRSSSRSRLPGYVHPSPHHFLPLFRGFAAFLSSDSNPSRDKDLALAQLSLTLEKGARSTVGAFAASSSSGRGAGALAVLAKPSPSPAVRKKPSSSSSSAPRNAHANPWTPSSLSLIFHSFLSLSPPPSSSSPSTHSAAPSGKTLFWLLLALSRASKNNNEAEVVLGAWEAVEEKFGREGGKEGWERGGRGKGRGLGDKRVERMVRALRDRKEEERGRWEEEE